MKTQIFSSKKEFDLRDDKTVNGVSQIFLDSMKIDLDKAVEQNKMNGGCWNCFDCADCNRCVNCTGCVDCSGCVDCINCKSCDSCTGCGDCDFCINCVNCKHRARQIGERR